MANAFNDKVDNMTVLRHNAKMMEALIVPDWAVTHVKRKNKITPETFCKQGKKTPMMVFIFFFAT